MPVTPVVEDRWDDTKASSPLPSSTAGREHRDDKRRENDRQIDAALNDPDGAGPSRTGPAGSPLPSIS